MAGTATCPAFHFLQAVHAGGGFFGHADDPDALRWLYQVGPSRAFDGGEQDALFSLVGLLTSDASFSAF